MSKNIKNKEFTFELKNSLDRILSSDSYLKGTKKLSNQNEIDIVNSYVNSDISMSDLALKYKVSQKTIAKVIKKNNIKTKYKGFQTKISIDDRNEIEKLYRRGHSIVDISKKYSVATTTIDYILNELNVPDRSDNNISSKEKKEVLDLYLKNQSLDDISEKFNISHRKIYTILRENNLDAPKKEKKSETRLIKQEDHSTIITLYKKGLGCWKIGKLLQIDHSTIAEFLKRSGIELRKLSWKIKKDENKVISTKNQNQDLLPKKGRGRPKKIVEATDLEIKTSEKRGRGRPKKIVEAINLEIKTSEKRGRGRPKKESKEKTVLIAEKKESNLNIKTTNNLGTLNLLGLNINLNSNYDKSYEFTDISEISQNTSNVYRINLSGKTLERIPEIIFKCENLEYLILRNNYIAEVEPKIKILSKLKELDLGENTITSLPDEICSLHNLKELKVDQNYLSELPVLISHLKNLEVLNASFNKIIRFNDGITKLTNLVELYLDNNEIPRVSLHIGNLSNLKRLDLNHNKLGTLPPKIGMLHNLYYLNLKNNDIEVIPEEFSNLDNLEFLDISDNYLKVPSKKIVSLFEKIHEFYADDKILKKIKPIEK